MCFLRCRREGLEDWALHRRKVLSTITLLQRLRPRKAPLSKGKTKAVGRVILPRFSAAFAFNVSELSNTFLSYCNIEKSLYAILEAKIVFEFRLHFHTCLDITSVICLAPSHTPSRVISSISSHRCRALTLQLARSASISKVMRGGFCLGSL